VPNACNRCHADRDTAWAKAAAERWYGTRLDRPTRHRARVIAAARRGEATAVEPLLSLLKTNAAPFWQAVAVRLLEPWIEEPPVQAVVVPLAGHPDALVRANVARALEPLAEADGPARRPLEQLVADPDRGVRIAAAWGLRATLAPGSPAGRDLLQSLAMQADQPLGQMRLGHFHVARGDAAKALEHFRRAVAWDPNSPPLRRELAVALSQAGDAAGAVAELEAAAKLDPTEAEFRFLLALAFAELGRAERVIPELEAALKLNPRHARAAYNLGLARQERGDRHGAIEALLKAEAAEPRDPRIPYARATIHAQLGERDAARTAARRAIELQPGWAEAERLLQSLSR
jgi:tetratricopeptide (TPR) repeat protein